MIKTILTSTLDKERNVIFKRYRVAFYLMRSRMRERVCRCTLGWSRIVWACAVNRAGTRRSRGTKWRQSIAGRPVGRCLRSSVGPRRGGLNGRRNAVKPFCHSRRSRVRRGEGYYSGVLRGHRAPLASLFSLQYLWNIFNFVQSHFI